MLYSYIALNTENQKLKGVISADSEQLAKKKLHQVGLSVLSLRETTEEEESSLQDSDKTKKSFPSFTFFVIDPQGKQLSGSIEAKDRKNALKRLAQEYGFEILSLASNNIPEHLRYAEGMKNLRELEEELEEEFGISFKHTTNKKNIKRDELHDEEFELERKEILKEIEIVSSKTQEILQKHHDKISPQNYDEITDLLAQLSRLRFSNNFILIRKLIEDLFSKIDQTMKKDVLVDIKNKNYKELLEEEDTFDEITRNRSGNAHKDVLGKLKKFSSTLDKFLGEIHQKKKKKGEKEETIFTEVVEDFSFFRRFIKSFFIALFTHNDSLKKERFSEVKRKYTIWKNLKKQQREKILIQREKKLLKRKLEHKYLTKELQIFMFIVDELHIFFGAVLFVLFSVGYVSFLIENNHLPFSHPALFAITHSEILPKLSIGTFFFFFSLTIRKKFFEREIGYSILFLSVMVLLSEIYFFNL